MQRVPAEKQGSSLPGSSYKFFFPPQHPCCSRRTTFFHASLEQTRRFRVKDQPLLMLRGPRSTHRVFLGTLKARLRSENNHNQECTVWMDMDNVPSKAYNQRSQKRNRSPCQKGWFRPQACCDLHVRRLTITPTKLRLSDQG